MPIVSRTLQKLANRDDIAPGMKRWRVDGVDARGNRWTHGPFSGTLAEAEVVRDTCWTQAQIDDEDEQQGVAFIRAGGVPEDFQRTDLTLVEWRRRLARKFWRSTMDEDRDFLVRIAPYIASFTATQIAASLGIPLVKAQAGIDRAIAITSTLGPALDADDAGVGEV